MASIIKPSAFDIDSLVFSQPMKNKQGSNTVYLNYNGKKKVVLQTPKMNAPFGLSEYPTETGPKFSLDASFLTMDEDTKVAELHSILKSLDDKLVKTACDNSEKWFGKTIKEEVVREFYRPLVKEGKQKKDSEDRYPDTVKFKIRTLNGDVNVEVYDKDRKKTTIDELVPGSKVRCIFELSPVWFVNKNFGITLNLIQLEVSKPEKITGFCFDDDEFEEEYEDIED